jgi:hypothetical protein
VTFGLQVKGPCTGNNTKGVFVPLERDRGNGVDFRNVEQPEELVLGWGFIVRQVRRAQDKPPLLPCLLVTSVSYECGSGSRDDEKASRTYLSPVALLPKGTRMEDLQTLVSLDHSVLVWLCGLPSTSQFVFIIFALLAT